MNIRSLSVMYGSEVIHFAKNRSPYIRYPGNTVITARVISITEVDKDEPYPRYELLFDSGMLYEIHGRHVIAVEYRKRDV